MDFAKVTMNWSDPVGEFSDDLRVCSMQIAKVFNPNCILRFAGKNETSMGRS